MKTFNINEYKKHSGRKLVLRHYLKNEPEIWAIEEAQVIIGNQLVIKVPETGYDTNEYEIVEGDEVRNTDGNLVGTVEFATKEITVKDFADKLIHLPVDETLEFSCFEQNGECLFGVKKIKLFDSTLIVIAACGGANSYTHDITGDKDSTELYKNIRCFLKDYLEDGISIDLCPKIEKEMWGVTFNYEEIDGQVSRKLAVTDCYNFFTCKADAEKWITDHSDGSYDSDFDKAFCSTPKVVLMDKWQE